MKKMKCFAVVLVTMVCVATDLFGQARVRKMPNTLNHPSYNAYAPYLSADANAIVYLSDNAEDNILTPFYTFRDYADWREPQMLPRSINTRMNFLRGYALNADGKKLYFSTQKTPSVGGFDIWTSDLKGSLWAEPVNPGLPINSKGHEACPSLTPDGNVLYFMRCERMDPTRGYNCKIFRAGKKVNGQWDDPVELPANINTGNSQSPRIMADGETLIFASDKIAGNKGGMDLYITRYSNGNWSQPQPLDFVNTEKDDQYISVAALGRYIVKDVAGPRRNELMEYLIPDQYRPKGMMKIDGKVTDPAGKSVPVYVSIVDLTNGKRVYNGRPYADGSFIVYIMEGSRYEIGIDPEQDNFGYFSKQFDLTSDKIPQVERVSATIKPPAAGDEFSLDWIKFKPYSDQIDATAINVAQMKRFTRMVKGNPNLKFEIQVMLQGYLEDSIQSDPDLTEVLYDSIHETFDDIDSLGQLFDHDTVMVETTYHNDRTWQQAQSIIQYFISQGANPSGFAFFGNAIPATIPEERKLIIKAVVQPK